jgi:hypothetical protein
MSEYVTRKDDERPFSGFGGEPQHTVETDVGEEADGSTAHEKMVSSLLSRSGLLSLLECVWRVGGKVVHDGN